MLLKPVQGYRLVGELSRLRLCILDTLHVLLEALTGAIAILAFVPTLNGIGRIPLPAPLEARNLQLITALSISGNVYQRE